ncbi:hypothetical protein HOP50_07g49420 [Chloropicon primus]|uniref:DUF4215 domain-containing protein n=1 Tax=Chloropicon primus TaxID=1764295 RepID=A0A5B8MPJ0_9CHLO|nr:hypothetical protein A3770_07p49210 [Chloropicon primus]UPR01620.1 hypothetical protein HOP50_07g49420 [Chloropicon primus]|eukprot:QDZ22403.1 hypothetical protein A3770_07p49210 [Chloropicon primus]
MRWTKTRPKIGLVHAAALVLVVLVSDVLAQKDCTGTNRGWLTNGADKGVHPTGLFGPLGLHGEHIMASEVSSTTVQIRVSEVMYNSTTEGWKYNIDGGMTQTGSSSYNPFKVGGNGDLKPVSYYPERLYKVNIICTKVCAFLASFERGTRVDSVNESDVDKRAALQVGVNTGHVGVTATGVKAYRGISNYTSTVNDMPLATTYELYWEAPSFSEINYEGLDLRVSVVEDNTATCAGKFYQYTLPSLLTCGDGIKDDLEECDDRNTVNGDGCSSDCKIEVGYTCETKKDVLHGTGERDTFNREYVRSYCTKAEIYVDVLGGNGVYNKTTPLVVTEGGEATFTVLLSTTVKPGKEVFVSLLATTEDGQSAAGQIQMSKSSLRFDSTTAQVAQPIIVTAIGNNFRDGNRNIKIKYTVSSTDENYALASHPDTTVAITDDDVASLAYTTPENFIVMEGGVGVDFEVKLTAQPYGTVVVTFSGLPDSQLMLTPNQLAFGASDWNVQKKVSVVAIDNKVVEGKTAVKIRPTITAPGDVAYEALNSQAAAGDWDIPVQVEDNDTPGLVVTPTAISIVEGEAQHYYTVALRSQMQSGAEVSVTPTVNNCLAPCAFRARGGENRTLETLTFSEHNWDVEQKVYVTYDENDMVEWRSSDKPKLAGTKVFTIEHSTVSSDPLYNSLATHSAMWPYKVTVNVTDNDIPGVSHPEVVTLTEGGTGQDGQGLAEIDFPMKLLSRPTDKVEVRLSIQDPRVRIYEKFMVASPAYNVSAQGDAATITWQPEEWGTTRIVRLRAMFDDSAQKPDVLVGMHIVSSSNDVLYDKVVEKDIVITIKDNDVAKVMLTTPSGGSVANLEVTEGGSMTEFEMYLNAVPDNDVTLKLTPSAQLEVSPSTVVFTPQNWSNKVSVQVKAVDDALVESVKHQGLVRFELTGGTPSYTNVKVPDLSVTVNENDFVTVTRSIGTFGGIISPTEPSGAVILNVPGGVLNSTLNIKLEESEKPLGETVLGSKETISGSQNTYERVSGTYSFQPHGQTFKAPVYITIQYSEQLWVNEFTKSQVQNRLVFLKKDSDTDPEWKVVSGGKFSNGVATLATTSFSLYKVVIEKDPAKPPESIAAAEARMAGGLAGQDVAKCINGFELASTGSGSTCGFKFNDEITTQNNIEVTKEKDVDEYRISVLVIILLSAVGLEAFIILGLIISLNAKKAEGGSTVGSNAIVPVDNPAHNNALVSAKIP